MAITKRVVDGYRLKYVLQNSYVEVLTPSTSQWDPAETGL